ncbi:MAG: endonuclease domain-containing protein [Desulfobacca sp.]|nr:endonuclease domain-containing protein [Desulfobacca sp.]
MDTKLINLAKDLRRNQTKAETLLWTVLRSKQLKGYKFRRQQPIGKYIVDFVCFEKNIIIEVDGGQHAVDKEKDLNRDNWLRAEGFKVVRFWNNDVLQNTEGVVAVIRDNLMNHPPLTPPLKGGE